MRSTEGQEGPFESAFDALAGTPEEADDLKARAALMTQLIAHIQSRKWTHAEAALRCGLSEPSIGELLAGRISRFTFDVLARAVQKLDAGA